MKIIGDFITNSSESDYYNDCYVEEEGIGSFEVSIEYENGLEDIINSYYIYDFSIGKIQYLNPDKKSVEIVKVLAKFKVEEIDEDENQIFSDVGCFRVSSIFLDFTKQYYYHLYNTSLLSIHNAILNSSLSNEEFYVSENQLISTFCGIKECCKNEKFKMDFTKYAKEKYNIIIDLNISYINDVCETLQNSDYYDGEYNEIFESYEEDYDYYSEIDENLDDNFYIGDGSD